MFSFLKNTILSGGREGSSQLSCLTCNENIYLEQVQNYIEVEGGYQVLKDKLILEINDNYCYDSPFVYQLTLLLRNSLCVPSHQKAGRALDIVEDLISMCGRVCNEAFHNGEFCGELQNLAVNAHLGGKILKQWEVVCSRATSMLVFLADKYENEGSHHPFREALNHLASINIEIPKESAIRELPVSKQAPTRPDSPSQNVKQVLQDIAAFAKEAQEKASMGKVDTMYVRTIKAKSKILYDMASKGKAIAETHQAEASQLYKRLRVLLKDIEKKNAEKVSKKTIEEEKLYLQKKMERLNIKQEDGGRNPAGTNDLLKMDPTGPQRKEAAQEVISKTEGVIPITKVEKVEKMEKMEKVEKVEKVELQEADLLGGDGVVEEPDLIKIYAQTKVQDQLEGMDLLGGSADQSQKKDNFGEFL